MIQYRIVCKQCGAKAVFCPGGCHAKGDIFLHLHQLPNRILSDTSVAAQASTLDRKKSILP